MFENLSSSSAKKFTRARLVPIAAALSAVAIAAPVSTAAAATTARAADPPAATVTGPSYISTAPTTFVNNNNQVSAGDVSSAGQSA
jgi:curli biogenesis system outer membrane secretion channel CsgG